MSKKTQRKVSEASASTERKAPLSGRPSLSSEFNPDYTAVKKDLKQIDIRAVTFISILVVLSFFLR